MVMHMPRRLGASYSSRFRSRPRSPCWRRASRRNRHAACPARRHLPRPPCPRPACNSTPSTGRPTRAPTSTSSPAAAGWRRTRSPPIDRAGAASTSCRNATTRRCERSSMRPRRGGDPGSKKIGDYYACCMDETAINAKGAAPLEPLLTKIAALSSANALAPLVAELHTIGVNRLLQLRRGSRLQGRVGRDGDRRPGRHSACRTATTTSGTTRNRWSCGSSTSSTSARCRRCSATPPDAGGRGGATRDEDRDRAREGGARRRLAPRPEQDLPQADAGRAAGADARSFSGSATSRGIGAPPIYALNVTEPDFFKALGQTLASTPIDEIKSYLRWHVAHASAPVLSAPFVDENFRFYGTHAAPARRSCGRAGSAACSTPTAISAKRSARRSSRKRSARRPRPTR